MLCLKVFIRVERVYNQNCISPVQRSWMVGPLGSLLLIQLKNDVTIHSSMTSFWFNRNLYTFCLKIRLYVVLIVTLNFHFGANSSFFSFLVEFQLV